MGVNVKNELDAVKTAVANGEGNQTDLAIEEQQLTVSKLRHFLPKDSKVNVSQNTVDMVNHIIENSGVHRGLMEERLMTYTHLLGPGVGLKQLLKAIQFTVLSVTPGMTQSKAYLITFPEKAQELIDRGADPSSHASQYAKTKIVQEIIANSQIGVNVTYAPLQHQLVEKLLNLSNGVAAGGERASATVQLNATLGLLDFIKPPEEQTLNLKASMDDESKAVSQNLADQIERMAELQLQRHKSGESLNALQKVGIVVDAEVIDED